MSNTNPNNDQEKATCLNALCIGTKFVKLIKVKKASFLCFSQSLYHLICQIQKFFFPSCHFFLFIPHLHFCYEVYFFLLSDLLLLFPPPPAVGHLRRKRRISFSFSLSPILTKSKSQLIYGDSSSSDDEDNLSEYCERTVASVGHSCGVRIQKCQLSPLESNHSITCFGLQPHSSINCEYESNCGLSC